MYLLGDFQVQERLTDQILHAIDSTLKPLGCRSCDRSIAYVYDDERSSETNSILQHHQPLGEFRIMKPEMSF